MAKDAELDRLKTAQDLMFQRKQDAHKVQQTAWERLNSARDAMNRAFEAKQRAYDDQDAVETNVNKDGKRKIDIYYGPNGPFGPGHHHAGALRSAPQTIIFDELR